MDDPLLQKFKKTCKDFQKVLDIKTRGKTKAAKP